MRKSFYKQTSEEKLEQNTSEKKPFQIYLRKPFTNKHCQKCQDVHLMKFCDQINFWTFSSNHITGKMFWREFFLNTGHKNFLANKKHEENFWMNGQKIWWKDISESIETALSPPSFEFSLCRMRNTIVQWQRNMMFEMRNTIDQWNCSEESDNRWPLTRRGRGRPRQWQEEG